MFKKLRDTIKGAVENFSGKVEDEADEVETTETEPEAQETSQEEAHESATDAETTESTSKADETKGFFTKVKESITTLEIDADTFNDIFWDLEVALLENNVALEVVEQIKHDMGEALVGTRVTRGSVESTITEALENSLHNLFIDPPDFLERVNSSTPYTICFVGINGSGKTTTLAKIAKRLQDEGKTSVVAAADTFRAASIEQLQEHTDKLDLKLIKHDYDSDPAAVAYDAVQHAESNGLDTVLIDTAGRLHSDKNLMQELQKLVRVNDPDMTIFIGESTTGNDCVEQASKFDEAVGIDGIILTKADVDEQGGAAISVSHVTGKPILFLGTGQDYDDLEPFDKNALIQQILG